MTTEGFVKEIRGAHVRETALAKHWGLYLPREVEEYVGNLQERLHNMGLVYQQQYEQMRTSLLGLTRERDELITQVKTLKNQQEQTPQRLNDILSKQGLVALPAEECERLQNMDADYKQQLNDLSAEKSELIQLKDQLIIERDQLSQELEERESARLDAQEANGQLEQAQAQAAARLEECQKLDQQLEMSYQQVAQLKMKMDLSAHRQQEQAELSAQTETQLNALNLEYQHSQEMTGQLLKEKERLEKEMVRLQKRWDGERASIMQRYQQVQRGQQQCMQRLRDNVLATVQCMESLGESTMISCPDEDN